MTHGQSAVYDEDSGRDIAIVYDGDAHAALISAAPDLLALLERLYASTYGRTDLIALLDFEQARNAIAKAYGHMP